MACRRGPADLEIEVTDTGAGIPLDFLPRVFDRFAQAETLGRTPGGGLGLGLAIVRNLVERHGGRVTAHSEGEGRGATFRVHFPLSAATVHRTAAAPPAVLAADPDHLRGVKVVVVDDHEDTRHLLAEVLGSHGAGVKACASVTEAIEAIAAERPDMVVSDIEMPGQDGYALIRHLRGSREDADVRLPAVALTGSARVEDRVRTLSAGFQMHVPKPVDPAELVHAVAVLAGRTR